MLEMFLRASCSILHRHPDESCVATEHRRRPVLFAAGNGASFLRPRSLHPRPCRRNAWRKGLLGSGVEAIPIRVEAITIRSEGIVFIRLEAIAIRLEAITIKLEATSP